MKSMINRTILDTARKYLDNFKAVAILGPRQCGKSTLAKEILKTFPESVYLDMENPADRIKLTDPVLFLTNVSDSLVCIDEIQHVPELFSVLRGIIDRNDRSGQFLVLGSASRDLIRQSSETLAGRIIYVELTPFMLEELSIGRNEVLTYLLRGGFPLSHLAKDDELSYVWRNSFISSFLERDISSLGFNYPPETMRRLWSFIAHSQGQTVNLSEFGQLLGISHTMVRKYVDLLTATFMVRILPPFEINTRKRMAKTPKIYIRDTGILHSLLHVRDINSLFSNPCLGYSWETMVLENILNSFEFDRFGYYRTNNGAEIDLILEKNNIRIGIECKSSTTPSVERGLYSGIDDLGLRKVYVIAPVDVSYPLKENILVLPSMEIKNELQRSFAR